MLKQLPLSRALVIDFKVDLVDLAIRNRVITESIAMKIEASQAFRSGECLVSPNNPLVELGSVDRVLLVHAYQPFRVTLKPVNEAQTSFVAAGFLFVPASFTNVWLGFDRAEQRVKYVCA